MNIRMPELVIEFLNSGVCADAEEQRLVVDAAREEMESSPFFDVAHLKTLDPALFD